MIDRSYLPFQTPREYQDPGMQKWMGFFLSEHTSSLHAAKNRVDFSTDLGKPQKLLLLSQLYVNQLKGQFTIKHRDRKITLFGEVRELSRKETSIMTSEGYRLVQLDNILQIQNYEEKFSD